MRLSETEQQRRDRLRQVREHMEKNRGSNSEFQRLNKFREAVKYGPIFTCTVCEQDMFINSVSVIDTSLEQITQQSNSEFVRNVFTNKCWVDFRNKQEAYIYGTCKKHIKDGKLPPMAATNNLQVLPINDKDLHLSELESNLIAKRIMFQKIYQLPKSRMAACKDHLINIPISSEDVINTMQSLPRTPEEAGLLEVKLKRKLDYKNTHQQAYIDPKKIYKALDFLRSKGHPEYKFYDDYDAYIKRFQPLKLQSTDDSQVERIVELDEHTKKLEYEKEKANDEFSDEDEEYVKKDTIRKFQFDYDTSVCLVDKYPEAALPEPASSEGNQISFAPGEGKIPENILTTKNWDRDARIICINQEYGS